MNLIQKSLMLSCALWAVVVIVMEGVASADQPQRPEFIPDELIIKFNKNVTASDIHTVLMQIRG